MKVKTFLRDLIPPIVYKVKNRLAKPNKEQVINPLPKRERKGDKIIIIGNGPSLNKTLELYEDEILKNECIMVNDSAKTKLFEKIRPSVFVMIDPKFYVATGYEYYQPFLHSLVDSIVSKTNWPLTIVMPQTAKGSYASQRFTENPCIEVLFYYDGTIPPNNMSKYEAWDKNYLTPPGQTVLNACVWLSIYWGYCDIYLVGADSTWLENLRMDQTNNKLYDFDTHFYSSKEVYNGSAGRRDDDVRYFDVDYETTLMEMVNVIRGYNELAKYADWKGVKVYNASEYSWIDAFERKKLR